jgi:hypothetical protein
MDAVQYSAVQCSAVQCRAMERTGPTELKGVERSVVEKVYVSSEPSYLTHLSLTSLVYPLLFSLCFPLSSSPPPSSLFSALHPLLFSASPPLLSLFLQGGSLPAPRLHPSQRGVERQSVLFFHTEFQALRELYGLFPSRGEGCRRSKAFSVPRYCGV